MMTMDSDGLLDFSRCSYQQNKHNILVENTVHETGMKNMFNDSTTKAKAQTTHIQVQNNNFVNYVT